MTDMAPAAVENVWLRRSDAAGLAATELHAAALSMLVARRAIRGTLPAAFVHDPSLEMLLVLYIGRPSAIARDELAAETTVPPAVAAHWIAALHGEGLVDVAAGMVELTGGGVAAMDAMLCAVVTSQHEVLGWGNH